MARRTELPAALISAPFRVDQALTHGVTRRRLRAGDLLSPFRGVRTVSEVNSLEARCRALQPILVPGKQYFSHSTAARIWGIPLPSELERDDRLHVSNRERRATPRRGVISHEVVTPKGVRIVGGLPVSTPTDAWCELAATQLPSGRLLTLDELIVAGDWLVSWPQPIATVGEIERALERFRAARGIRMLRQAWREMRAGSASPRETRLRLLVCRAPQGFPTPELNQRISLPGGRITHGDLMFVEYRVLLEYDGGQHRTDETQFLRDVDRMNALALAGWHVVRVHKATPNAEVLRLLSAALRARGWKPPTASSP